jgi:SM-20-related protein
MDKLASGPQVPRESPPPCSFAVLNGSALESAPLIIEPYQYIFARDVIAGDRAAMLLADAPQIPSSGSFPLSSLTYGAAFKALTDDLESQAFRQVVERKFDLDLGGLSTTISVRGRLRRAADGYVHTDLEDKVISVLLYLNPGWRDSVGALRVLRSQDIGDYALEIPPEFGNMLIFRRSDRSWHGHLPYEGRRLSLQLNWVRSPRRVRQYWRHRLNFLKGLTRPGA